MCLRTLDFYRLHPSFRCLHMVLTLLLHFETILKFVLFIISYQKTDVQEMTLSPILNVQNFKAVIPWLPLALS